MAFLCRLKQPHLKNLSNQLRRCFFQPLLVTPHSRFSTITKKDSILHNTHFKIFQTTRSFAAPAQFQKKQEKEEEEVDGPRLNESITAPSVRLVLDTGHTVVSTREALERAKSRRLDLVEVDRNAKPPVCKIFDYNREKYVKELKEKERAKSKSEVTLRKGASKSVQFEGKIEEKDLQMKAATVKRMMESGYRVKCLAKMNDKKANDKTVNDKKGNDKKAIDKLEEEKKAKEKLESERKAMAIEYENLRKLLARFCTLIEDVAIVESGPEMEKKGAYVVVRHVKYGLPKKGTKKTSQLKATSNHVEEDSSSEADIDPVNESPLLDDRSPTSHPPEASLNIENRYKKDPRSRDPPTEMNIASPQPAIVNRYMTRSRVPPTEINVPSPQPAIVNRYIKDLRNRSSPTETNSQNADPGRLHPQPPYQGRQPPQYPNQGRQPPQYPNQGSPTQVDPRNLTQSREVGQGQFTKNSRFPAEEFPRKEVSYPGALPNSSGQKYGVPNGPKPNSTTEPQPTVVNRYKQALNQNLTVPNFHGSRRQGR
ncbi:translation initiation factor IF3-1, mitochondrial [Apium graveolens]|uniref:translation initiation factor IF3-1, mitochondrial n=1 Tax=Apium graveolens TaxID=4045 RepID=UPI003D7B8619